MRSRRRNARVKRFRNRNRSRMIKGGAFTFESIGTIAKHKETGKRLLISFDNDELSDKNIKIYIRESRTVPTRREMGNLHLDHKYLNVPILTCSNNDVIKIKFLYIFWMRSLDNAAKAKLPDFVWADHLDARWNQLKADDKKQETLAYMQQCLTDGNYQEMYMQLLKYDDPFGAPFEAAAPQSPAIRSAANAAKVKLDKDTLRTLRKMELANKDLESNQQRLQTRRLPPPPQPPHSSMLQKLMRTFKR